MPVLPIPSPPLTDGATTLRLWEPTDAEARSAALQGDPEMIRWTDLPDDYPPHEAAIDIARGHELRELGERLSFAIVDASGAVIGGIDLMPSEYERAELGYAVTAQARRQGHATRAVRLLSDWALTTLDIHRIELPVPTGNIASRGVATRAGFNNEGTLHSYLALRDEGPRYDVTMFGLVRHRTSSTE